MRGPIPGIKPEALFDDVIRRYVADRSRHRVRIGGQVQLAFLALITATLNNSAVPGMASLRHHVVAHQLTEKEFNKNVASAPRAPSTYHDQLACRRARRYRPRVAQLLYWVTLSGGGWPFTAS